MESVSVSVRLLHGNCLALMPTLDAESVDAVVTDPPYGLSFMGKAWDHGVPGVPFWTEALRVLKPGGHLLAFGGTRTHHRLMVAIEDAGFEVRDCLMWLYGSGFPKSLDVSKAIDKAAGADRAVVGERRKLQSFAQTDGRVDTSAVFNGRAPDYQGVQRITAPATPEAGQWSGWGTALKPSWEPIILARKPFSGTVVATVLAHGTGAINVDGCRIHTAGSESKEYTVKRLKPGATLDKTGGNWRPVDGPEYQGQTQDGRWPANVVLDEEAGALLDAQSGERKSGAWNGHRNTPKTKNAFGQFSLQNEVGKAGDTGGASRFFYTAKASASERGAYNDHPTVKPLALMRWLVRLVTPPGGVVLDPFLGSGSTAVACQREDFSCIGIEQDAHSVDIARRRLADDGGLFSTLEVPA